MDHCSASTIQGQFRRGQGLYICLCQWLWEIDTRAQIEEDVTYNNFVLKKQTKASWNVTRKLLEKGFRRNVRAEQLTAAVQKLKAENESMI